MFIGWICQIAFGAAALTASVMTCSLLLRRDERSAYWLVLTGAFALAFFLTMTPPSAEMILAALLLLGVGAILLPDPNRADLGESTATRRR